MEKRTLIAAILIVIAVLSVSTVLILTNDHGSPDPYDSVSYVVDDEDIESFNAETLRRCYIGNDYTKWASLFLEKAVSDDDRDGDGNSTVRSFSDSLKEACPSETSLPEFLLGFLQNRFEYVPDEQMYPLNDWALYPAELLSLKKGDCEDFAILSVAVLSEAGYDCGIALFKGHAAALIAGDFDVSEDIERFNSLTTEHDGKTYYIFDASFDGPIGYITDEYCADDMRSAVYVS